MKSIIRKLNKIMMVVAGALVWFGIFCFASPEPTAWYLRKLFEQGEYSRPKNYEEIRKRIKVIRDIDYGSAYENGIADLIRPKKERRKKLPVIFWMHGGAYVGGDKQETESYCVCLADKGFAVVNFNYALSPETHYPAQVIQVGEVYRFFQRHAEFYGLDMENVYFGGDSAGAQILSVFLNIQTNEDFARKTGIKPVVQTPIRGTLLYCGPYNLRKLEDITTPIVGFMLERAAWAYIGAKNWADTKEAQQNDIFGKLTDRFPPAFLTDGNTVSFGDHMERLESELQRLGVPVRAVYYPRKDKILGHEYQFHMADKYAQETFEEAVAFLGETQKDFQKQPLEV
ncbi:MAG: alpha/beta hydrolase [Christensenella sp.]|nr:alpha/beta hydrolase [Christensenella sp.]